MATDSPAHKTSKKRKAGTILLGVIILIVVIRLILLYVVLHFANKSLAGMNGYYGHIDDIDLAIIRGACKIDSIYINKADTVTGKQTPFPRTLKTRFLHDGKEQLERDNINLFRWLSCYHGNRLTFQTLHVVFTTTHKYLGSVLSIMGEQL